MSVIIERKKVNVNTIRKMKADGEKIVALTAYDYTSARILSEAGIDIILVGDSLGMVMNGQDTTLAVTVDEVIYHTKAVKRGIDKPFLVVDMPFGSYQAGIDEGVSNAVRIIKESGADAIKLEGGSGFAPLIKRLTDIGINVMGHIGLMPQKVNTMGGYKISGRENIEELITDATMIEEAGAFAIVLEGVVADVSKVITGSLKTAVTIGIGAGNSCDGQVLVYHDIFGLYPNKVAKFVKQYLNLKSDIFNATKNYIDDVKSGSFPADEHSFIK